MRHIGASSIYNCCSYNDILAIHPHTARRKISDADKLGTHADGDSLNNLSRRVIGCAFIVLNALVAGGYSVDPLVELKTVKTLNEDHHAQCVNYLKATSLRLRLLLNFGNPRLEIKRIAHRL